MFAGVVAYVAVALGAEPPIASVSPDHLQRGKPTTLTIGLDNAVSDQNKINHVRLPGLVVDVQPPNQGKLSVTLPGLDNSGIVKVEILAGDAVVSTASLTYVDPPKVLVSPDHVQRMKATTVAITLDNSVQKQNEISRVRLPGLLVDVKPPTDGKLSVPLPGLENSGQINVEVLAKDDMPVAVGQLTFGDSEETSSTPWGLLLFYVALIVVLPVSCTLYDTTKSYAERTFVLKNLLEKGTPIDQVRALLVDMDRGPTGLVGLTRGVLAVTLILVLAFAVFHLVVFGPMKVPDIAEKLLMLLAGTLTAITGFYFGSKAATESAQQGAAATVSSTAPKVSGVLQGSGANNKKLAVSGSAFGATQGTVNVTDQTGTLKTTVGPWTDTSIEVTVDRELKPGNASVIVTTSNGRSSDPRGFTAVAAAPETPKANIIRIDPTTELVGAKVKVIGEGFGKPQGKGVVTFGGKNGDVTRDKWDDKEIEVTVPTGVTGTVDVVVKNDGGISSEPCKFAINP